jgi:hypothetical protein
MEHDMDFYDGEEFLPLEGETVFVLGLYGLWEAIVQDNGQGDVWFWWQEGYTEPITQYQYWADYPTDPLNADN